VGFADLTTTDWVIASATLIGPILAVQAQKLVERARETRGRKLWVFHTLMATRGGRLHADHVRALNMIDLTFYGPVRFGRAWRSKRDQAVLDSWKEYLDHLADPAHAAPANPEAVFAQRDELFVNMLFTMGKCLGYEFDRVQLKKGGYSPAAHGQNEERVQNLVTAATDVLQGNRALRIAPVVHEVQG